MQSKSNLSACPPLLEACTLDLYKKNIFRVTGLPVDATSKEVSRQVQKLQMLAEMGGGAADSRPAFSLAGVPTSEEIRDALSRMKEPEQRLIDEFFWFWPEEFGKSKEDPAIQAMLAGDTNGAYQLWEDREMAGSHVAQHNLAIMYHMYAVDWTNYHIYDTIDDAQDIDIQRNWRKSFERWEPMVDSDALWDMLKERVRSLDDEALTTGFVRRMLKQLPEALDRVNAEAALKLAEQGRMDGAKFHVDFMRETHPGLDDVDNTSEMVLDPTKRRVEQQLESFANQVNKYPQRGADLARELLNHCRPMMKLFDLFHGADAHQRNDLFDHVAETVLQMVVSHQKSTGDNESFVHLLKKSLELASGASIRERIMKNISIGEGNILQKIELQQLEAFVLELKSIEEHQGGPWMKYVQMIDRVMPQLPNITSTLSDNPEHCANLRDSVAIILRNISLDSFNNTDDIVLAKAAIKLALQIADSGELKTRLEGDKQQLERNRLVLSASQNAQAQSGVSCLVVLLIPSLLVLLCYLYQAL